MTAKELLHKFAESEKEATARVIRALPKEKMDYTPDPKSKTAKDIMNIILWEPGFIESILKTGGMSMDDPHSMPKAVEDPDEAAKKFEKQYDALLAYIKSMPDTDLEEKGSIGGNGSSWSAPRALMAMGFIGDMIHHRGQLSAYLRPMGGKVPSIYGPSGDSGPVTM